MMTTHHFKYKLISSYAFLLIQKLWKSTVTSKKQGVFLCGRFVCLLGSEYNQH